MPTLPTTTSTSGITEGNDGSRFIPASVRPDGTTRKEIRVRPGYRPPEDVQVYKNATAEAWRSRGKGSGVPGADPVSDSDEKTNKKTTTSSSTTTSSKNAKKRAAKKRAKEKETADTSIPVEEEDCPEERPEIITATTANVQAASSDSVRTNINPEDKEKQAKAIRKKIRQATELKHRKENGENLLPEQLEKVVRISELTQQLKTLGLEAEE